MIILFRRGPSSRKVEKKTTSSQLRKPASSVASSSSPAVPKDKIASTPMHDRHKTFFEADMSVIDHLRRKDRGDEGTDDSSYNVKLIFL